MLFKQLQTIMEADEAPKKETKSKTTKQKKYQATTSDGIGNELFKKINKIDEALSTQTLYHLATKDKKGKTQISSIKTKVEGNTIVLLGAMNALSKEGKEISHESIVAYFKTLVAAVLKADFDKVDLTFENYETPDLTLTIMDKVSEVETPTEAPVAEPTLPPPAETPPPPAETPKA